MSNDARIIAVLADLFDREGRDGVLELVQSWKCGRIGRFSINGGLMDWLGGMPEDAFPRVELVSSSNRQDLISASETFRKSVRGEEIGALG
jgi:hypothetical protein